MNGEERGSDGGGNVGRPAVNADHEACLPDECGEFGEVGFAKQIGDMGGLGRIWIRASRKDDSPGRECFAECSQDLWSQRFTLTP